MTIDITEIVKYVIGICVLLVTSVLLPLIRKKTTAEKEKVIKDLIAIAVTAAEQIYKDPGSGQVKKDFVIAWLMERGINLDGDQLDAMIEAAVYDLTHIDASNKIPGKEDL